MADEKKSEPTFAAGDKVRLNSGGPVMTVQACSNNLAYCVWFVEGELQQGTFDQQTLVPHCEGDVNPG